MTTRPECESVRDDLEELALGTLNGLERSTVLAHVQGCATCRDEVERLSAAADTVLTLAPAIEPSAGFETRLFERMGVTRPRRWRLLPRRIQRVAAIAATGALGLGLGLGLGLSGSPAPVAGSEPIVANLTADHVVKGEVYIAPGHPGWLFMSVHGVHASGEVTCHLRMRGGQAITVGTFYLRAGSGSWLYRLPVAANQVASAWLVQANGGVLASARLPS